jgi:single-strand DNA-binding protein
MNFEKELFVLNLVLLVGRVAREVKLMQSSTGKPFMFLTIAVDGYYDRKAGKTTSDFIPVTVWGKEAERCKALVKGSLIEVKARVSPGRYEKDGKTQYTLDLVADEVKFLSKPKGA